MIILNPLPHETIWGGNRILHNADGRKIGHLYMVSGHRGISNMIINGTEKDRTLDAVFMKEKEAWGLSEFDEFPLTIALVDASDDLSIQVHPDDRAAQELEGKRIGKKESWLFLEEPESGWIYAGCSARTKNEVEEAVRNDTMEQVVGHLPVSKGDYVCISAGTLHAMTAGSLVYEIEYGSNYTYRFYDYNRVGADGKGRELHIRKALKSIDVGAEPRREAPGNGIFTEDVYEVRRCPVKGIYWNSSGEIECISVLQGNTVIEGVPVGNGMSLLLFPGEQMDGISFDDAIIARLRRHADAV